MDTRLGFSPFAGSWEWFALLAAILLAALIAALTLWARHRKASEAGGLDWARRCGIVAVILALAAGPTIVSTSQASEISQTTVVMAVDVTGSMAVGDAHYGSPAPLTRIEAARRAVDSLVTLYAGAHFEAISFGSSTSVDLPRTADGQAVRAWARGLQVEPTAVSAGSSLSQPLDTLIRSMQTLREKHRGAPIAFYYISDGEQTSRGGRRTFSTLRQFVTEGATIGVGSERGGRVPLVTTANAQTISASPKPLAPNGYVTDPTTRRPGISQESGRELRNIADECSGQSLLTGPRRTVDTLQTRSSLSFQIARGQKRHRQRTLIVWPLELLLTALLVWELGVDVLRARRYL